MPDAKVGHLYPFRATLYPFRAPLYPFRATLDPFRATLYPFAEPPSRVLVRMPEGFRADRKFVRRRSPRRTTVDAGPESPSARVEGTHTLVVTRDELAFLGGRLLR